MTQLYIGTNYKELICLNTAKPKERTTLGNQNKQKVIHIQQNSHSDVFFATHNTINVLNPSTHQYGEVVTFQHKHSFPSIGFYCPNNQAVVSGFANGSIDLILNNPDQNDIVTKYQSNVKQLNKLAGYKGIVGDLASNKCMLYGRDVLPFIFDFNECVVSWKGKNVPHDQLDLKVPIQDVSGTIASDSNLAILLNANRKIRVYDIRANQKRPIVDQQLKINSNELMTVLQTSKKSSDILYVATDSGSIFEIDRRKSLQWSAKFKGAMNASVTDIKCNQTELFATTLDGNLRTFNLQNYSLESKIFLNRALSCICIANIPQSQQKEQPKIVIQEENVQNEEQVKPEKVKKIRKRNKVGLAYLRTPKAEEKMRRQTQSSKV